MHTAKDAAAYKWAAAKPLVQRQGSKISQEPECAAVLYCEFKMNSILKHYYKKQDDAVASYA